MAGIRELVTTGITILGMTGAAIPSGMVQARESDPRLATITFEPVATVRTTDVPIAVARSLSDRDRVVLTRARSRSAIVDVGPLLLSLQATRLRSAASDGGVSSDRLSVMTAGGDAGLDLASGFSLHAFSSAMRARRRLGMLPGTQAFGSSATTIGIGMMRDGAGLLTLDYTSNTMRGERGVLARMAERIGGASPAGSGARLMFASATPNDRPGRLGWTVSAAALRRSFGDGAAASLDRRAEIAFRLAL